MTMPMDGDKSYLRVELPLPFIEQPPSLVDWGFNINSRRKRGQFSLSTCWQLITLSLDSTI
jgi:hypothetical protein